jgi:IS4 transposase
MLGQVFARFMEKSPVSVMVRGMLERALNLEALDAWYEQVSDKQYTRTLLFSTVYDLLSQVVFKIKPSVHAAYQEKEEEIGVSVVAVYNKLKGVEVHTAAELVRFSVAQLAPLVHELGGERATWVPGYRVKILDGNCIEATEHRLKELRGLAAGALPGKSLVVDDPALGMVVDVFPCADGHAQERSLLHLVLPTLEAGDLWIEDRNFCTRDFLCGTQGRGACFLAHEHQGCSRAAVTPLRSCGTVATGHVAEQWIEVVDAEGQPHRFRRIAVRLKQPTREGEDHIAIITNLPRSRVPAKRVAELYRQRWTIETAFQDLEGHLHSEINTLGYPQAALFGFCLALVAYNTLAVVFAARRSVHGEETVDQDLSGY